MSNSSLNAISPIDGRYSSKTSELNKFFSEKALMKYRLIVEIEYFISLCEFDIPELQGFDSSKFELLRKIYIDFSDNIISYLTLNGHSSEYGARPLKRLIEKKIGTFIADEIIKNNISAPKKRVTPTERIFFLKF